MEQRHPVQNLLFCRDQQIVTAKGLIIARLASPQREPETVIMKFCFQKLGLPIVGEIKEPGCLEGGDFIPLGKDLCLIGVCLFALTISLTNRKLA